MSVPYSWGGGYLVRPTEKRLSLASAASVAPLYSGEGEGFLARRDYLDVSGVVRRGGPKLPPSLAPQSHLSWETHPHPGTPYPYLPPA